MSESISNRMGGLPPGFDRDLRTLFDSLRTDLVNLQTDLATAKTKFNATNAQLDLDAGVTDADYAANNDIGTLVSATLNTTS